MSEENTDSYTTALIRIRDPAARPNPPLLAQQSCELRRDRAPKQQGCDGGQTKREE
jgi:hypothetical protein